MELDNVYSTNWRDLGTILVYEDPDFQFKSQVVVIELDYCLVKPISTTKLYDTLNNYSVELFDMDFIDILRKESADKSIIILSNQVNTNKLNMDVIKQKTEEAFRLAKIDTFAIFAMSANCFMKPHTGMWKFVQCYYAKHGHKLHLDNVLIVSNEGGIPAIKEKKNGDVVCKVKLTDSDRAFAWNIGVRYLTIEEYIANYNGVKKGQKYVWSKRIIEPSVRIKYVETITKYNSKQPNVFKELAKFGKRELYIIMIMGAPRSGKTTFARNIVGRWRAKEYGKNNAIKRLGLDKYTPGKMFNLFKKLINDRITIIIDGNCHTNALRKPFIDYLKTLDYQIPILYIEVNPGLEMAKVFNHAHVEDSNDDKVMLYKAKDYYIYKSISDLKPHVDGVNSQFITCFPIINEKPSIMNFRY